MSITLRAFLSSLLFLILISSFIIRKGYYSPSSLQITGNAIPKTELTLSWDSGNGFNEYEVIHFKLLKAILSQETVQPFEESIPLPQIPLKRILVESKEGSNVTLVSAQISSLNKVDQLPLFNSQKESSNVLLESPFTLQTRTFHPVLLFLQCCLAIFIIYLFWMFLLLPQLIKKPDFPLALKAIFFEEGRWKFWAMFVVSSTIYTLWLLAYYPGAMTNDSWDILRETQSLQFTDWHPYLYTMYLILLMQLSHSIEGVAIFQLLATAALGSYIFYYVINRGVKEWLILPFFIVFITSIPIGLHNLTIWKDVPFSLAVTLTAFLLYRARLIREQEARYAHISPWSYFLLALLILILCQTRQNGIIFYFVLPLVFFGNLSKKHYVLLCASLFISYFCFQKIVPHLLKIQMTQGSAYHHLKMELGLLTHYNYYSDDKLRDIKAVEQATNINWNELSKRFPRKWFSIWDESKVRVDEVNPLINRNTDYYNRFLYPMISANLPIVISILTYEFLHSIAIDDTHSSSKNEFYENPCQIQGSNLAPPGNTLFGVSIASQPKSKFLSNWLSRINTYSRQFNGLLSPQVLIWNLAVYLIIFAFILWRESGVSAINLFIGLNLFAMFSVFAVGAGESWRYFYYIYLSGLFVIPLYFEYLHATSRPKE